jgi:integrase
LTVADLVVRFMTHAGAHYRRADGSPTSEVANFRYALHPLVHLYSTLQADQFSPLKLEALRELMAKGYEHPRYGRQEALVRTEINARCGRVVRVFKWAVSEELVAETTWRALTTVKGLQKGRCEARETEPVKPVPADVVEATLPHLTAHARAAVSLQMLTGARADEVLPLRGADLDRSGAVWIYTLRHHKGSHLDKVRRIPIGPKGQETLAPLLKHRCPLCGTMDPAGRIAWCATAPLCGPCRDRMEEAGIQDP